LRNEEVQKGARPMKTNVNSEHSLSEDEATTMTLATPEAPQSMPLKGKWIEQVSSNSSELTAPETDHPEDNDTMTDPPRPSIDPVDMMDGNKCRPARPTEPPNKPKGTRGQWGMERAETGVPEALRGIQVGSGNNGNEEC
jgi:hypothetical protein